MNLLVRCLEQSSKHILSNGGAYDGNEYPMVQSEKKKADPTNTKVVATSSTKKLFVSLQEFTPFTITSTWGNRFATLWFWLRIPGSKALPPRTHRTNLVMSGRHSFKVSGFFCVLKPPEFGETIWTVEQGTFPLNPGCFYFFGESL